MKIDVSIGEAIDKYSILEIKSKKINDPIKNSEIIKEIGVLKEVCSYINDYLFFYNLLVYVNEKIWDITNEIKNLKSSDASFSLLSNEIFEYNQKRFRIKNFFNLLCNSSLKEQKSYSSKCCKVIIKNEDILVSKIPELYYLSIEYDFIYIETNLSHQYIKSIFQSPTIIFSDSIETEINLSKYTIEKPLYSIFSLKSINYLAGGKMGDFILSLSIICENFYKTGRKGNLYLCNYDLFSYGLEKSYNDTYELIMSQPYISSFTIYKNESIDINLTEWRNSQLLYKANWREIYTDYYNISWGKHKWLFSEKHKDLDNTILISTTSYRFPENMNYKDLIQTYKNKGNNVLYISQSIDFYEDFMTRTSLSKDDINFCQPSTFSEMCLMIHSCKLFIGNLSAPLAIAFAFHKEYIVAFSNTIDDIHNKNIFESF